MVLEGREGFAHYHDYGVFSDRIYKNQNPQGCHTVLLSNNFPISSGIFLMVHFFPRHYVLCLLGVKEMDLNVSSDLLLILLVEIS